MILEIESKRKNKVLKLVKAIKKNLKQEAIGLAKIGKMNFL